MIFMQAGSYKVPAIMDLSEEDESFCKCHGGEMHDAEGPDAHEAPREEAATKVGASFQNLFLLGARKFCASFGNLVLGKPRSARLSGVQA